MGGSWLDLEEEVGSYAVVPWPEQKAFFNHMQQSSRGKAREESGDTF